MQELKQFDVMSVGKVNAIVTGVIGLVVAVVYLCLGMIMAAVTGELMAGIIFIFIGVAAPIGYALMGFLMGLLIAWVYNVVARRYGGIRFELKKV